MRGIFWYQKFAQVRSLHPVFTRDTERDNDEAPTSSPSFYTVNQLNLACDLIWRILAVDQARVISSRAEAGRNSQGDKSAKICHRQKQPTAKSANIVATKLS